jgi:hypothetical protein
MDISQASNFIGNSDIPEYAKKDLNELLESQQETIESLKCCGNCGIGKITSEDEIDCKHWFDCKGNSSEKDKDNKVSFWQPIK